MENIKCKTRRYRAFKDLHKWQLLKGLVFTNLNELNQKNKESWDKLRTRHPGIFSASIPMYLNLVNKDFIVTEVCTDIHTVDQEKLSFFLDIVPIVQEYIIALLLTKYKYQYPTEENILQYGTLTSILNPITQVAFTLPEMIFFIEQFTINASSIKTTSGKIINTLLTVTGGLTTLSKFMGFNTLSLTSWSSNQILYWQKKDVKDMNIIDFMNNIQESLKLVNHINESSDEEYFLKRLAKIWNQTDFTITSKKLDNMHQLIIRIRNILKPILTFINDFSFLLPTMIESKILILFFQVILSDWLFFDSKAFILSQLFQNILPLKESSKFNERMIPFEHHDFLKMEAIQELRQSIWTLLIEQNVFQQNIDSLVIMVRNIYKDIFTEYLQNHWSHIEPAKDYFLQCLLLFNFNSIVKYKPSKYPVDQRIMKKNSTYYLIKYYP